MASVLRHMVVRTTILGWCPRKGSNPTSFGLTGDRHMSEGAATTPSVRVVKVRGRFPAASGVATVAEVPEESTLEIEIDASSVDTQDETRDAHMRSNDFFGVEDHPTISFRSTGIRPGDGETNWKVDGELTIKGVTRPVTVELEFLGGAIDPWGNQRIGFSGVVPEVNREDWGLTWNAALETGGFLLSKSVRLEIEAELIRK